jgi:hypothetical protein
MRLKSQQSCGMRRERKRTVLNDDDYQGDTRPMLAFMLVSLGTLVVYLLLWGLG